VLLLFAGFGLTDATGLTNLATTVIRVFTPDGTLVVEVDDPRVKVTIEDDGGVIITGVGPQEVRLKAGSYRVRAAKDGKAIKEELVSISQGGKEVVKISVVPKYPEPTAQAHLYALTHIRDLFNRHCIRCHGLDGRGMWDITGIPDFSDARWQASRSDDQFMRTILEGVGKCRPPAPGTFAPDEGRALAQFVRRFGREAEAAQEKKVIVLLYNRSCIRCHGADGRGMWDIPKVLDFTDNRWQASRTDAEIVRVILEGGKGTPEQRRDSLKLPPHPSKETGILPWVVMPSFQDILTPEQALGVARYVRTFAPAAETPDDAKKKPSK
jgi:mono/diheme cytochrome c family protein